jgi:hypothetical protein
MNDATPTLIITGSDFFRLTGIYPVSETACRELMQDPRTQAWIKAGQPRDERGKAPAYWEGGP